MTDPMTLTAEFRSSEWELVLKYEDGSLPATQWNVETLTIVARWYAKNLDRDAATARYRESTSGTIIGSRIGAKGPRWPRPRSRRSIRFGSRC